MTKICVTPTDLAAFLEGRLTGEERERVVRHLNRCPDCFERYIGAARLLDAIEEEEQEKETAALAAADVDDVEQNLFHDDQDHLWGKWRPSEEAKRLGPVAVQLDRLLSRDGYSLGEAFEVLRTNYDVRVSPKELADLAAKLQPRAHIARRSGLHSQPSQMADMGVADLSVRASAEKRRWAQDLLKEAIAALSPEDRLIVEMQAAGVPIAAIARKLNLEQKPLYRRLERIFASLRSTLESRGIRAQEIADLLLGHESDEPEK